MKSARILSQRLAEHMKRRPDLDSQYKISQVSSVSQSTVGRVLNLKVDPTLSTLDELARVFSISPLDLLADGDDGRLLKAWRRMHRDARMALLASLEGGGRSGEPGRYSNDAEELAQALDAVDDPREKMIRFALAAQIMRGNYGPMLPRLGAEQPSVTPDPDAPRSRRAAQTAAEHEPTPGHRAGPRRSRA